jgi:hypothetical protein
LQDHGADAVQEDRENKEDQEQGERQALVLHSGLRCGVDL